MKRLLIFALICVMVFTLSINIFAEEVTSDVATGENAEAIVEETSNKISQILGISGTVGIGAIIVAVIVFFLSNFKKIQNVVNSMASVFKNIFSKDGNIENVPQAFNSIKTDVKELAKDFNDDLDEVKQRLEKSESKNEQLIQIITIFIINCTYINPYAKSEILKMISSKEFGENVAESIKKIQSAVEEAQASEEKAETPYLDKVTSEVSEEV